MTATGTTSVNIAVPVSPRLVTMNNVTKNYTSGTDHGPTQLIKQGGSLTLSNTGNDYTGGTTVRRHFQLGRQRCPPPVRSRFRRHAQPWGTRRICRGR
jgi:autotransporter-associated beta strand protein